MSQTCVRGRAQCAQLQQTLYDSAEEARCCLCVLALRPFHMCRASSAPAWACAPLRLCPLSDRVCGSSSEAPAGVPLAVGPAEAPRLSQRPRRITTSAQWVVGKRFGSLTCEIDYFQEKPVTLHLAQTKRSKAVYDHHPRKLRQSGPYFSSAIQDYASEDYCDPARFLQVQCHLK
jgi:hypothetical protein